MTGHHYQRQHLNIKDLQYLTWGIPSLILWEDIVPHYWKETVRLHLDEHKDWYRGVNGSGLSWDERPFNTIEELREAIGSGGAI